MIKYLFFLSCRGYWSTRSRSCNISKERLSQV